MNNFFTLTLNDEKIIEYARRQRLPGKQREFLERMDQDMSSGIKLDNTTYSDPDQFKRVQYVVMHLIRACENQDEHMQDAMCAYLTTRSPNLEKVIVTTVNDEISVEFKYKQQSGDE